MMLRQRNIFLERAFPLFFHTLSLFIFLSLVLFSLFFSAGMECRRDHDQIDAHTQCSSHIQEIMEMSFAAFFPLFPFTLSLLTSSDSVPLFSFSWKPNKKKRVDCRGVAKMTAVQQEILRVPKEDVRRSGRYIFLRHQVYSLSQGTRRSWTWLKRSHTRGGEKEPRDMTNQPKSRFSHSKQARIEYQQTAAGQRRRRRLYGRRGCRLEA